MKVKITQVCKVTREIDIDIDAPDIQTAIKLVENDEVSVPGFDDQRWYEVWDLQHETVSPANTFRFTKGLPE